MRKIFSLLLLLALWVSQFSIPQLYAESQSRLNSEKEKSALILDTVENIIDSWVEKIEKKIKKSEQKERLEEKHEEIKEYLEEVKEEIKDENSTKDIQEKVEEAKKVVVLKVVSWSTEYEDIEKNISSDVAASQKEKKQALEVIQDSLEDNNGDYSIIVKTKYSHQKAKKLFATFDEAIKMEEMYEVDGEKYYEVFIDKDSVFRKEMLEDIESGILPETFVGIKIVLPEVFGIGSLIWEDIWATWWVERYKTYEALQSFSETSKKIKVAVVDTGIDYTHPDLQNNVNKELGKDFVNRDDDAYNDQGHGTHVAGTIAASVNGKGIIGVNPYVQLVPLKICTARGFCPSYAVLRALEYAKEQRIDILNMSLWGRSNPHGHAICKWISSVVEAGGIVIAASGNSNIDTSRFVPGGCSDAITVGAYDTNNKRAVFSNYGAKVDVSAPGVGVYSTYPQNKGSYKKLSGTSMATPHIVGLTAILQSFNPSISAKEVRKTLKKYPYALNVDTGKTIASGVNVPEMLVGISSKIEEPKEELEKQEEKKEEIVEETQEPKNTWEENILDTEKYELLLDEISYVDKKIEFKEGAEQRYKEVMIANEKLHTQESKNLEELSLKPTSVFLDLFGNGESIETNSQDVDIETGSMEVETVIPLESVIGVPEQQVFDEKWELLPDTEINSSNSEGKSFTGILIGEEFDPHNLPKRQNIPDFSEVEINSLEDAPGIQELFIDGAEKWIKINSENEEWKKVIFDEVDEVIWGEDKFYDEEGNEIDISQLEEIDLQYDDLDFSSDEEVFIDGAEKGVEINSAWESETLTGELIEVPEFSEAELMSDLQKNTLEETGGEVIEELELWEEQLEIPEPSESEVFIDGAEKWVEINSVWGEEIHTGTILNIPEFNPESTPVTEGEEIFWYEDERIPDGENKEVKEDQWESWESIGIQSAPEPEVYDVTISVGESTSVPDSNMYEMSINKGSAFGLWILTLRNGSTWMQGQMVGKWQFFWRNNNGNIVKILNLDVQPKIYDVEIYLWKYKSFLKWKENTKIITSSNPWIVEYSTSDRDKYIRVTGTKIWNTQVCGKLQNKCQFIINVEIIPTPIPKEYSVTVEEGKDVTFYFPSKSKYGYNYSNRQWSASISVYGDWYIGIRGGNRWTIDMNVYDYNEYNFHKYTIHITVTPAPPKRISLSRYKWLELKYKFKNAKKYSYSSTDPDNISLKNSSSYIYIRSDKVGTHEIYLKQGSILKYIIEFETLERPEVKEYSVDLMEENPTVIHFPISYSHFSYAPGEKSGNISYQKSSSTSITLHPRAMWTQKMFVYGHGIHLYTLRLNIKQKPPEKIVNLWQIYIWKKLHREFEQISGTSTQSVLRVYKPIWHQKDYIITWLSVGKGQLYVKNQYGRIVTIYNLEVIPIPTPREYTLNFTGGHGNANVHFPTSLEWFNIHREWYNIYQEVKAYEKHLSLTVNRTWESKIILKDKLHGFAHYIINVSSKPQYKKYIIHETDYSQVPYREEYNYEIKDNLIINRWLKRKGAYIHWIKTWTTEIHVTHHEFGLREIWEIEVLPKPKIQHVYCETVVGKTCWIDVKNSGYYYSTDIPNGTFDVTSWHDTFKFRSERSGSFTAHIGSFYGNYITHVLHIIVKAKPAAEKTCEQALWGICDLGNFYSNNRTLTFKQTNPWLVDIKYSRRGSWESDTDRKEYRTWIYKHNYKNINHGFEYNIWYGIETLKEGEGDIYVYDEREHLYTVKIKSFVIDPISVEERVLKVREWDDISTKILTGGWWYEKHAVHTSTWSKTSVDYFDVDFNRDAEGNYLSTGDVTLRHDSPGKFYPIIKDRFNQTKQLSFTVEDATLRLSQYIPPDLKIWDWYRISVLDRYKRITKIEQTHKDWEADARGIVYVRYIKDKENGDEFIEIQGKKNGTTVLNIVDAEGNEETISVKIGTGVFKDEVEKQEDTCPNGDKSGDKYDGKCEEENKDEVMKIRYIRDWIAQNDKTSWNHWWEIQVFEKWSSVNIAKNKPSITNKKLNVIQRVTDGDTTTRSDSNNQGLQYVQVDLWNAHTIDIVKILHHHDGRTYHKTKTEVSADGENWFTIFDSAVEWEYIETADGKSIDVKKGLEKYATGDGEHDFEDFIKQLFEELERGNGDGVEVNHANIELNEEEKVKLDKILIKFIQKHWRDYTKRAKNAIDGATGYHWRERIILDEASDRIGINLSNIEITNIEFTSEIDDGYLWGMYFETNKRVAGVWYDMVTVLSENKYFGERRTWYNDNLSEYFSDSHAIIVSPSCLTACNIYVRGFVYDFDWKITYSNYKLLKYSGWIQEYLSEETLVGMVKTTTVASTDNIEINAIGLLVKIASVIGLVSFWACTDDIWCGVNIVWVAEDVIRLWKPAIILAKKWVLQLSSRLKVDKISVKVWDSAKNLNSQIKLRKEKLKISKVTSYDVYKIYKTQPDSQTIKWLKNIVDDMKENGYDLSKPIKIYVDNGKALIIDWHHRFEAAKHLWYWRVPIQYIQKDRIYTISGRTLEELRFLAFKSDIYGK